MSQDILEFHGEHWWLSNFSDSKVNYEGVEYPTVEHAYQAAKTLDVEDREKIRTSGPPAKAKKLGRKVVIRADWESIKFDVMESLLRQKFAAGTELAQKLIGTGDGLLVEGNYWNDFVWGVCNGVGQNHLGRLLMEIRNDLKPV